MPKTNSTPSFDPAAAFGAFKMPAFDVDALVALQNRNIEAFSTVQKMAADSIKVLTDRQVEIARGAIDEYVAAVGELYNAKDPKVGVAKQVAYTKSAVASSVAGAQELTEMAVKANTEVFDVLTKRVVEGLDVVGGIAKKA